MVNNKVIVIGRLTRDVQVIEPKDEGQKKIAHFSLAVDRLRKKTEENRENSAYFLRCSAFDRLAEFLEQYGKKGVKFAVEGHLSTGSYEKDGVKIQTVEIIAESIQFCEKKERPLSGEGTEFLEIPEEMEAEMPFQ